MPDPMADSKNYDELLKTLGRQKSYTWKEVKDACFALNNQVLGAPPRRRKIEGSLEIVKCAERDAKQKELIATLVELVNEGPTRGRGEGRKDLKALEHAIDAIDAVAVREETIRELVEATSSEMRDAVDRLDPGIVVLKDVKLGALETMDEFNANRIRRELENFDGSPRDLYEFLGRDSTCSTADLHHAAGEKYKEYRHVKSHAGTSLAGDCQNAFKSDDQRKRYDNTLVASVGDERASDGDELRISLMVCGGDKRLERDEIKGLLKKADEAGLPRERVIQYIWSWALGEGIEVANVTWPLISDLSTKAGGGPGGSAAASPHAAAGGARRVPPGPRKSPMGGTGPGATGAASPRPAGPSGAGTSKSARSAGGGSAAAGRPVVTLTPTMASTPWNMLPQPSFGSGGHSGGLWNLQRQPRLFRRGPWRRLAL